MGGVTFGMRHQYVGVERGMWASCLDWTKIWAKTGQGGTGRGVYLIELVGRLLRLSCLLLMSLHQLIQVVGRPGNGIEKNGVKIIL